MFYYMAQYADNLRALYETPTLHGVNGAPIDCGSAGAIIEQARQAGRTILTEYESKQLLAAYGIPTVETRIAQSEDAAVQHGGRDRLPGGAEAALGDDHAQDRRGRRAAEPGR